MKKIKEANTSNKASKKKQLKTEARLFRFTKYDFNQLQKLSKRYGVTMSKVMDLLVAVTRDPNFVVNLDRYVVTNQI